MIITGSLTVCYDGTNLGRLSAIEDTVCKVILTTQCQLSGIHRNSFQTNSLREPKRRQNFRRFNLSIPLVRYSSSAISSRFRQAKPKAE